MKETGLKFTVVVSPRYDSRGDTCFGMFDSRKEAAEYLNDRVRLRLIDEEYKEEEIEEICDGSDSIDLEDTFYTVARVITDP